MNKYCLFIVLCFTAISISSYGQEAATTYPLDKKYQACVESDGSTPGILECISNATKEWDKELNKYYKLLLGKLNQSQQSSLRESQRQWLAYQEKETKFYLSEFK